MSLESQLGALKLGALPPARYVTAPRSMLVREALERMRDQKLEVLVILEGDAPTGVLTAAAVRDKVLGQPNAWEQPVDAVAEKVEPLTSSTPLKEALSRLETQPFLPLVENGKVANVLSRAGVLRHLNDTLGTLHFNEAPGASRLGREATSLEHASA